MADVSKIKALDGVTYNLKDSGALRSHQSVTNNAPTLSWGNTSTVGSVGGTALTVKMPANPNTDAEVTSLTLYASNWSNSIYTISDARITANSIQEFQAAVGITDAQLKALQSANIQDGGQDAGHAYLRAYGTVPTIDIPIQAIYNLC